MLAEISSEGVGYLLGTFAVPFILGWILTKKWYYGLLIAFGWMMLKFAQPRPAPTPSPLDNNSSSFSDK